MMAAVDRAEIVAALSGAGWRIDGDESDRIEASDGRSLGLTVFFEDGMPVMISYGEKGVHHEMEFPGLDALFFLTPQEAAARLRLFENPLFDTGVVTATPAALAALGEAEVAPSALIERHTKGDWGEVPNEDAVENERSVSGGFRIISSYAVGEGDSKVWIITEADRSSTCILLPEDY